MIVTDYGGVSAQGLPGWAYIELAKYSDATYHLEVTAQNGHGSEALTVDLCAFDGSTAYTGSSITIPPNSSGWTRYRSAPITNLPPTGTVRAYTRDGASAIWFTNGAIADVKIIILQSHATEITDTVSHPQIGAYMTVSTEALTNASPKYIYYDSRFWEPTPTVECYFTYSCESYKDYIQLDIEYSQDNVNWTQLETVQVFSTGDGTVHHASFGTTFTMVDKAWYRIRILTEDDKDPVTLYNAYLYIVQTDVSNILQLMTQMEMISEQVSGAGNQEYFARYDPNEWDEDGGYLHFVHTVDCSSGATFEGACEYATDNELDGSRIKAPDGGISHQILGHTGHAIETFSNMQGSWDLYDGATWEAVASEFAAEGGKIIGMGVFGYSSSVPTEIDLQLHAAGADPGSPLADGQIPVAELEVASAWHIGLFDTPYESIDTTVYWIAVLHNDGSSGAYFQIGYSTWGDDTYDIMGSDDAKSTWSTLGLNFPGLLPIEAMVMPGTAQDLYTDVKVADLIFSSKIVVFYKFEAGAGVHNLVMDADNYHVNEVDDPLAITQKHSLAVNDAFNVNEVTPTDLTLVRIDTLAMDADNYHEFVVIPTDLTIVPIIPILVNDAFNENVVTPTDLALTQKQYLTVADSGSDIETSAVALTQKHNLTVADSGSDIETSAVALTQKHNLTVADCFNVLEDPGPITIVEQEPEAINLIMDADNYHAHDCEAADYVTVTVFDPKIPTGDSAWEGGGLTATTYHHNRYKLKSIHLARSGRYIRILTTTAGGFGMDIKGMSIGRMLADDSPQYRETPTRITFNTGNPAIDLNSTEWAWSDWIEVNLDADEDYIIHVEMQGNLSSEELSPAAVANMKYMGWCGQNWSGDETMIVEAGKYPLAGKQYLDYRQGTYGNQDTTFGARTWVAVKKVEIRGEIVLDEVSPHDLLVDDAHHHMTSTDLTFSQDYLWDFRGYAFDTQPSDWTEVAYDAAYYAYEVKESLSDCIGGRYLNLNGWTISVYRGVGPDELPIWRPLQANYSGWHFDDFDLLTRWQTNNNVTLGFALALRAHLYGSTIDSGYMVFHNISGNQVTFQRRWADTTQPGGNVAAKAMSIDTWYWTRVRANGQNFKIKVWAADTEEPAGWDLDVTETDWNFEYGSLVPLILYANTMVKIDYYEIGTGENLIAQAPIPVHVGNHALEDDGPITLEQKVWLTVQNAEHDIDTSAIALTQKQYLTVADPFNVLEDDAPVALTQIHILTMDADNFHVHEVAPTDLTLEVGAIDLVVADCFHTHDVDDLILLTQTHILILADCFHLHDVTELLVLTQEHTLTMDADNFHLHDVDELLALTQEHTLVMDADNFHLHDVDELLALTQVHILTMDGDNYHPHVVNPTDLTLETTGTHVLVMQDAFNVLEDPGPFALTQEHDLVVADCENDHFADGLIALTQEHDLAVADCFHLQDVTELLALTQTHILTVASCENVLQDTGPVALTQLHILTVADAFNVLEDDGPLTITVGAIDLVVASCEHTVFDPGPVTLTQKHILTLASAFHVLEDDGPITIVHISVVDLVVADCEHLLEDDGPITLGLGEVDLVVADASHEHFVENVDLVQVIALIVASCYHIHAPPAFIDLTQTHILGLNDSFHVHDAETPTLELIITVSDCDHEHLADNVVLAQEHELLVADCDHELDSDNVAMIVPLTVQGLTHEVTSDTILLLQDHLLAVGGISHVHVSDAVVLTQLHNLTVLDTYILHTADNVTIPTLEGDLDHLSLVSLTTARSFGKIVSQRTIIKAGSA
jgi:hypothetical protein